MAFGGLKLRAAVFSHRRQCSRQLKKNAYRRNFPQSCILDGNVRRVLLLSLSLHEFYRVASAHEGTRAQVS